MLKLRSENKLTNDNLEQYIESIPCFEDKAIFINHHEIPKRIVAIGDIHGDLEALFSILLRAEIINIEGKWQATDTFVVQTGDIMDKGRNITMLKRVGVRPDLNDDPQVHPQYVDYDIIDKEGNIKTISDHVETFNLPFGYEGDEIIIYKFLADLNTQAISGHFGNSRVLLCCGNHEVSNVIEYIDDNYHHAITYGYIHPMDALLFGGPDYPKRRELLTVGTGLLARKLGCMLKVIVVIGDFIFCHGGLNLNTFRDIHTISELDSINNMFKQYLIGDERVDIELLKKYVGETPNGTSITWFRHQGNFEIHPRICSDTLKLFAQHFGNPNFNLVIGHSVQATCHDEKSSYDITIPRPRFHWDRTNQDGSLDRCITLPTSKCNNQIYRIDTAISRMNGASNYQYPVEGRLNSLIINLNRDGSKRTVIARNNVVGDDILFQ
jgi:hypothetical protein